MFPHNRESNTDLESNMGVSSEFHSSDRPVLWRAATTPGSCTAAREAGTEGKKPGFPFENTFLRTIF